MRGARLAICSASLLCLALGGGCAIAPQPAPASTLQIPTAWRTAVGPSTPLEASWWQGFGDPALNALVDRTLAHNTDLRMAQARMREYQARLRIAGAAQAPGLSATLTPLRLRELSPFGVPTDVTVYQGQLQASYEIDMWGRLDSLTNAARADLQGQQAAADGVALTIAAAAASGYLNLRGLDAQLELARATLASRQTALDLAERLFQAGYNSRLDWLQAQAEYRATAALVPQLERAITQQENALSVLSGANPGPIPRGPALTALTLPPIGAGLPSELLRRRPDILQAERAVAAADANLAAARDQLLPSIRLTASAGVEAFSLTQLVHSPFSLWSIGGSVLAPLLNGGRLRAETDVASSARDRAVFAYENAVRAAFADTDNALVSVQRLVEQVVEAKERSTVAAEALRIAHNRYQNGYSSYLEELDAQRTRYSADANLLQLQTSLLAAHVDLYRALGGGWLRGAGGSTGTGATPNGPSAG